MGLLQVESLNISYADSVAPVVADIGFAIARGESLGMVGESGAGKSQTAMAIMGLLPGNARITGSIRFDGTELLGATPTAFNKIRARRIAMVFQDPMNALNPFVRIGDQLRRILLEHNMCKGREARKRTLEMLEKTGLPDPERQYRAYPHQLSGGMRQRAMIAAALLGEPDLLVADEPTTALDVTVQAQILRLLRELRADLGTALLLITHDLGVVAGNCERMFVMENGHMLEEGLTADVFSSPVHENTARLLAASPKINAPVSAMPIAADAPQVLSIDELSVSFREQRAFSSIQLHAVHPLSLHLRAGETVAIVGESGSGKTSLARAALGLIPPRSGKVSLLGKTLADSLQSRPNSTRRQLQMVFQDPIASLNPAMRIGNIIAEPIRIHEPEKNKAQRKKDVKEALQRVGLDVELHDRYPHELSGGQAQRVAIARALVLKPQVLICDEAVAALDGSVQNEILQLLLTEQERSALAVVFITHDLAVVRQISHRVLVMYLGKLCELADNKTLFSRPRHPYTKALLSAVPVPDPQASPAEVRLAGEVASMISPPSGCPFHPRCEHAIAVCAEQMPEIVRSEGGSAACHRATELDLSY
ncbi:MAG: peptide/nickel transport system ATP-binding protein [Woeseiaceae bacterium]|jgi:peptide/nickel transport system ATP-binding protein